MRTEGYRGHRVTGDIGGDEGTQGHAGGRGQEEDTETQRT